MNVSYSLVHDTTDLRLCRRHRDLRICTEPGWTAYRMPYDWIPQLTVPKERRVTSPALGEFRVP